MVLKNADSDFSPRISTKNWLLPVLNNQNTPPATPNDGDRYRVTAVATGLWTGQENTIAVWEADAQKWRFAGLVEPQIWYDMTSQNWHYMSHAGVITQFDKIPLAISDVTGLQAALDGKAPLVHKSNHVVGGTDAFIAGDLLDATAKHNILNGGVPVATRRGLNVIPGANISFTAVDNAGAERVDLTINAAVGGAHPLLDGVVDSDTIAQAPARGMLIIGNATPLWSGLALGTVGKFLRSNGNDLLYALLTAGDIPDISATYIVTSQKAAPNGVSSLDGSSHVVQDPASKGNANGVCDLDASTLVPASRLSTRLLSIMINQLNGVGFGANTSYLTIAFCGTNNSGTESLVQTVAPIAFTWKNLTVQITANSYNGTMLVKSRKNGVDGAQVVTIGAGFTGIVQDTTHTDSVANQNLINYVLTTGTANSGTGTILSVSSVGS